MKRLNHTQLPPDYSRQSMGSLLKQTSLIVTLLVAAVLLSACDFGVENPGPIEDEALNTESAVEPLVVGMGADLSAVFDEIAYFMGIASRDIYHSGVFEAEQFMQEGEIEPRHVNGLWADMHRARWASENGIERMQNILGDDFESNPFAIEAYTWAGFSNRVLGENVCQAIIDGGEPQSNTVHFERAEDQFSEAIRLAEQQGESELLQRAHAGRAQVRLGLERWSEAASDAAIVPDDFEFEAEYSTNSSREENWLVYESHTRSYFSVYGTFAAEIDDPRVPWEDQEETGVDGETPFYIQLKYTDLGSDIQLAAGDEMRLIEAEVALREDGDIDFALDRINAVRAEAGAEEVNASSEEEAWNLLRRERAIILWMEGRRLWDLRRFEDPFLDDRDSCIPPSENEAATNPNL